MKSTHNKSEVEILRQKAEELLKKKSEDKILELIEELAFQNEEKAKRADELIMANKELAFQNEEKAKRADELLIANKELAFQNEEKAKRADELLIANKELAFQNEEKAKRADELLIANALTLKLTHELEVHQIELEMQNDELLAAKSAAVIAAEKYLELYDFAPTGYLSLSNIGKITEINQYGEKMLGKERSYLKNNPFGFFVSNDTKPSFNLFLGNAFTRKNNVECDVILSTSENPGMHVHLTGVVKNNEEQCLVTMVDITERKQAEKKLHKSEEMHRSLFDISLQGIVYQNSEGFIINANPAAQRILGLTLDQMQGRSSSDPRWSAMKEDGSDFPGEEHPAIVSFKTRKVIQNVIMGVFNPSDQIVHWINISASPLFKDGESAPHMVYTVFEDITDRKQAVEVLRESEEQRNSILNDITDVVWSLSWPDMKVNFISPSVEQVFGRPISEFAANPGLWADAVHPDDKHLSDKALIQLREKGFAERECRIVRPDGSIAWVNDKSKIIVDRKGKPIRIDGISRDITDRRQAEEEIKSKNELLIHTNAEKDKFFSIISHDLRGPFNGFLGLSKLLAEDLQRFTPEDIKKIAGSMRDSATNLFSLLENLLEWSRLQRGITSFKPESFLLMPMIDDIMHAVMDSANKKEIEISYEIQADLEVFADEYMLASTIRNLASNAVKFTLKGGKVTIAAKSVPGHSVEISIRDTGIGMNHEMVHDLFRLDVQTNRKGTDNEPSSGLGLLLCKDFVEKHGGKLWVESEEGKGSVFYFTIPNHAEVLIINGIIHGVSEEDKEVQIKRMKILIAEDDEISDSLISAMVDKYSYEVLHVNTGVDAIHACLNNPDIDLVLMDINLTGMDGFEATRQIRQFNNDVVIIAQTAFSLKFDRVMAIEAGCNDYINKPISNSELQGLIRKYFTE